MIDIIWIVYLSRPFFTFSFWVDQFFLWLQLVLPWVQAMFICSLFTFTGSPSWACLTYSLEALIGFPDSSTIGLPSASSSYPLCLKAGFQLSLNCASEVARFELARNLQVKSSWHAIKPRGRFQAGTQLKAPRRLHAGTQLKEVSWSWHAIKSLWASSSWRAIKSVKLNWHAIRD